MVKESNLEKNKLTVRVELTIEPKITEDFKTP